MSRFENAVVEIVTKIFGDALDQKEFIAAIVTRTLQVENVATIHYLEIHKDTVFKYEEHIEKYTSSKDPELMSALPMVLNGYKQVLCDTLALEWLIAERGRNP